MCVCISKNANKYIPYLIFGTYDDIDMYIYSKSIIYIEKITYIGYRPDISD